MTLEVLYHPEALAELRADVAWYEERGAGLVDQFERAVEVTQLALTSVDQRAQVANALLASLEDRTERQLAERRAARDSARQR